MKPLTLCLLVCLGCLPALHARSADHLSQAERLALEQAVRDLTAVQALIEVAQRHRSTHTRFALDYPALEQDLTLILQGLERHLNAPVRSPRPIEPLQGEYRP